MAKVCDRCNSKKLLYDVKIKNKKYELCVDCCDVLINVVGSFKQPKGFAKVLKDLGDGFN